MHSRRKKYKKPLVGWNFSSIKGTKRLLCCSSKNCAGDSIFLCKCIVPGRAFLRRLYAATKTTVNGRKLKLHHHVKITIEHRLDLMTWKYFLHHPTIYYRSFMQPQIWDAEVLDMYSDASRNFKLGFGAYCGPEWTYGQWDEQFCIVQQPSIEYLELYAVTIAILNWLKLFENRRIVLFVIMN